MVPGLIENTCENRRHIEPYVWPWPELPHPYCQISGTKCLQEITVDIVLASRIRSHAYHTVHQQSDPPITIGEHNQRRLLSGFRLDAQERAQLSGDDDLATPIQQAQHTRYGTGDRRRLGRMHHLTNLVGVGGEETATDLDK